MYDRVVNRVLKLINSRACFCINVPLTHCAVLRSTEKTSNFKGHMVDFVGVTDQCLPLVLGRIVDVGVANETIAEPAVDSDLFGSTETNGCNIYVPFHF
jgi:hypothetical protein